MSEKLVAVAIRNAETFTTCTVKLKFRRIVHRKHGSMLAGPFNRRGHVWRQNRLGRYLFVAEESLKTLELCLCCQRFRETLRGLCCQAAHDLSRTKTQTTVAQIDCPYVVDNRFHALRRVIHARSR